MSQKMGSLESGEDKETDFPPWTSRKEHSPDGGFILVHWDPCYLPDLQKYTVIHLFVVISYNSHRKLT